MNANIAVRKLHIVRQCKTCHSRVTYTFKCQIGTYQCIDSQYVGAVAVRRYNSECIIASCYVLINAIPREYISDAQPMGFVGLVCL